MSNSTTQRPETVVCSTSWYQQCYAIEVIWKTIPLLLLILGTIGNCLSVVVLLRRQLRKYTIAIYLTFLSLSDLAFLWSSVLRNTLSRGYHIDLKELSVFHCRLNDWTSMTSAAVSAYTVALLTIERTLLSRPIINQMKTTPKRVIVILITAVTLIGLVNSHLVYGYQFVDESSVMVQIGTASKKCVFISAGYRQFHSGIWNIIVLCVYNILPASIITIGNIIIAVRLLKQNKKVRPSAVTNSISSQQSNRSRTGIRTLFILSAFFMMTVTPYCIFMIVKNRISDSLDDRQAAILELVFSLVYALVYCNFSFNFVLYNTGASLFRKECKALANTLKSKLMSLCRRP